MPGGGVHEGLGVEAALQKERRRPLVTEGCRGEQGQGAGVSKGALEGLRWGAVGRVG